MIDWKGFKVRYHTLHGTKYLLGSKDRVKKVSVNIMYTYKIT